MPAPGRLPHVLVIDDCQEILDLVRELLEEEGYRVTTSRALPATDSVKTLAPDIILQDLRFEDPQEEGWTFVHRSRLDSQLARIPLILCTTSTRAVNEPQMAEQLERQDIRVVRKPFNIEDLLTALREVLTVQALSTQATAMPTR